MNSRHCQLQRSRLDTCHKLREEVVLYAEARGCVAPKLGQVSKTQEDKDDPVDVGGLGQWKGRNFDQRKGKDFHWHWQRKRNRKRWKGWCDIIGTSEHTENSKSVLDLREKDYNRVKDIQILLEREAMRRANQAKVVERKENPKMLKHLCGINSRVQ